jgi:drug/metabolite transporter (DMT)-like permease
VLAPFAYLQIIFMTASSWLIFNQPPEIWLYIGAPIVIASGLFIWLRERKMAKLPAEPVG